MSIDSVIKYWDKRPCNIRHSTKQIGTKEYFEEVTKKKYKVEPHILEFANFEKWKNKDVLEVGCGIGTAAQSFIENGANYEGIDISSKSIEIANDRLKVFDLKGKCHTNDIEKMNNITNKYDLIYSFGVLHHTPNIEISLKNIYNMLKRDGTFKLMLYAKNSLKNFKIKDGLDQYEAQSGVPIANTYSHNEIYDLLSEFKNINIHQTHIFPYKIPEYKEQQYVKEDYFENMPPELFNCLERNLGWHLCISCNK
uniref:Methyltransferase type 12 domain-containing protein n=1 Tax=viral metagenome TaxID=1070528 RepID=A0A6C0C0Z4_9ZZZZ